MSYAAPFAYAAKALTYDPYAAGHHPRPQKQRRRRIRATLLPSLRPRQQAATAPTAMSTPR